MSRITVDLDLVRKYNRPGPRYTSYPTAPHFTDEIPHETLLESFRAGDEANENLSLYFHIPFCETLCWFCGCTTVITKKYDEAPRYLDILERELDLKRNLARRDRPVVQLHFGGGSPTYLNPSDLRRLGRMIHDRFTLAKDVEASCEIDPRGLTHDHVKALREVGFTRASIGVQDDNPKVQEAVNRIQPLEMTAQVIGWIREEGFTSLNVDLIYGLPYQTPESFETTLNEILALSPDRFAVFSYAHVPWLKRAQKILERDAALPSAEVKLQLLKLTIEKLTESGYDYIGMDHFARTTDELSHAQRAGTLQRNFQGYSTWADTDILAYGMSAISQTRTAYIQNEKELHPYSDAVRAGRIPIHRGYILSEDDRIRRVTIMRLMCDMRLDYELMSRKLEIDFADYFRSSLEGLDEMEADGLVERLPHALLVSDRGRLLIRNIAMHFDAYLKEGEDRFSRTV
jgi:oxygen-independent coproporphyrinogen III oxidase